MFLSKKKAKKYLRDNTGLPYLAIDERIEKIAKTRFGKREKIKLADLNRIVEEANKPTVIELPPGTKPMKFRKSILDQLHRNAGQPVF